MLFNSIRLLVRNSPVQQTSTAKPTSVRVPVSRTPRYSRVRLHVDRAIRISHTNHSSIRRFAAIYLLVGGAATG